MLPRIPLQSYAPPPPAERVFLCAANRRRAATFFSQEGGTPYRVLAEYGGPSGGVHEGPVTSLVWDGSVLVCVGLILKRVTFL